MLKGLRIEERLNLPQSRRHFNLQSIYQTGETHLRVLYPTKQKTNRMVHILPVEPHDLSQYGDGLDTFCRLNLHNQYHVIAVSASFSHYPWYGNHPTASMIQQERYYVEHIIPTLQTLHPTMKFKHLLLGFSKSGIGAMSLMLRHLHLFNAVSVWDTTFMEETPDKWEMREIFGTNTNYDAYKLKQLLPENVDTLRQHPRIALSGYGIFQNGVQASHQFLVDLDIPHLYSCDQRHAHRWDSGWMTQSMAMLDRLSK